MPRHRIGIVGCGGIAHAHIRGYREIAAEFGEVVAGCDPDKDRLDAYCDEHELPLRFTRPRELIDSGEVDVISLLTPPAVRGEVISPAAERGVHLLVEKPFGENLTDAAAFVRAADSHGVTLAVNQQLRFMPDALAARELIESGRLGEVRFIGHDHFQNRTDVRGWRAREERLEISIFSIHVIDRIQWLAGREPRAVTAMTRSWNREVEGETFAALTIDYGHDLVAGMVSNWHSPTLPECRLRVDGTEGSLLAIKQTLTGDECSLEAQFADGETDRRDLGRRDAFTRGMGESMSRLLAAIDAGDEPLHSGRDNLKTMAIVDAAYLSAARGGARVEIADIWPE